MAVNYNDGKWHGWNGGECPVHPETVVECATYGGTDEDHAKCFDWDYREDPVIAFRVIKEHREPREFTLYHDGYGNYASWTGGEMMPIKEGCEVIHIREVIE